MFLTRNSSLGTLAMLRTQHLLITSTSESLVPCCETDVWVKIFHKLKPLHRAADFRTCSLIWRVWRLFVLLLLCKLGD